MAKDLKQDRWNYISTASRSSKKTPSIRGIYCFISCNSITGVRKVLYVGKSIDLSVRLKIGHKAEKVYYSKSEDLGGYLILKVMPTLEIDEKEIKYIKRLKPFFNICHNPNIKRKITYQNGETIY
jgi:excinuclease UvrABC nuclease subunit